MKIINSSNSPLKVKDVDVADVNISEYDKNSWLLEVDNEYYMAVKRKFNNNVTSTKVIELENAYCNVLKPDDNLKLNVQYGDKDATIVDMHGIDNFRFAKSLVFNDSTVRKIILKLKILEKDKKYFRFGASGARESDFHPGGEVYESMLISGKDTSGYAQSVSGYLPHGKEFSKSISLYDRDKRYLRDERIVYSHTAILKKCEAKDRTSLYIKINPKADNISFLDVLNELATKLGMVSYAVQMCIQTNNTNEHTTQIKGRVLRHMPMKPFDVLQDATDIGLEQLFTIDNQNIVYGVGTKYDRYEPEWKEFTGGRQYERRGHIHATIVNNNDENKHEVFHLRDAFISQASNVQVVLTPVDTVYRIYPLYKNGDKYLCKATDKNIDTVLENIRKIDKV